MNREQLIDETIQKLNMLPDGKIQDVNQFADFLRSKVAKQDNSTDIVLKNRTYEKGNRENLESAHEAKESYPSSTPKSEIVLLLSNATIELAKEYAQGRNISLSEMFGQYLQSISNKEKSKIEITPFVQSLSGVIEINDEIDIKAEYAKHLIEKYK